MVSATDRLGQFPSVNLEIKDSVIVDHKIDNENNGERSSFDIEEGDAALKLIGAERTVQFSDEYNCKLRRKLVRMCFRRKLLDPPYYKHRIC